MIKRKFAFLGVCVVTILVALGVFASNGWFPRTDPMTGKKTGWFGSEPPAVAGGSTRPLNPSATPQLSKEYIYAGSRLLAAEDAAAAAAPPADIAVWRGSNGYWYVQGQAGSAATAFSWGGAGDAPMPGDYDGDGRTDFCVYRSSDNNWYIVPSGGGGWYAIAFGAAGDIPVTGDFDGDGRTDLGLFRLAGGNYTWYIRKSSDAGGLTYGFGVAGDVPAPADYDGDGRTDAAVYRPGDQAFYIHPSSTGASYSAYIGQSGIDCTGGVRCVVSSDYDGDGRADPALFKSSTAHWYVLRSATGSVTAAQWGAANDAPVHNDYDGDGRTDYATYNHAANALWWIAQSAAGTRYTYYGTTGDIPVPAYYRR